MRNNLNILQIMIIITLAYSLGVLTPSFLGVYSAPASQGSGYSSSNISSPGSIYPTIEQMQEWCGAEPDGVWGPETNRLYKQKLDMQYGNQISLELWPEKE